MDILGVESEGAEAVVEGDDAVIVLERAGSTDSIVGCVHRVGVDSSDILVFCEERSLLHIEELLESVDTLSVLVALEEPSAPVEELEVVVVQDFLELLRVLEVDLTLIVGLAFEFIDLEPRRHRGGERRVHSRTVSVLVDSSLLEAFGVGLVFDQTSYIPRIGVILRLIVSECFGDEAASFSEVWLV